MVEAVERYITQTPIVRHKHKHRIPPIHSHPSSQQPSTQTSALGVSNQLSTSIDRSNSELRHTDKSFLLFSNHPTQASHSSGAMTLSQLNAAESIHTEYDLLCGDLITRSAMCVPLMNAEGVVLAVMKLTNRYPSNVIPPRPTSSIPTPMVNSGSSVMVPVSSLYSNPIPQVNSHENMSQKIP